MFPIASTTLTTAGTISFSSIPQTFTHLQVRIIARDASFSGISGVTWYPTPQPSGTLALHYLTGNGSTVTSGATASTSNWVMNGIPGTAATAGTFGSFVVDLLDYSNTNKNKTARIIGGCDLNGSGNADINSGLWVSTNAITGLFFQSYYGNFAVGTRIDLYGISTSSATGA
jgi:hypothetical protein